MLTAGVSCLDITPPLGTKMRGYFNERTAATVHDPLHVRSFAVEQDGAGAVVAICDVIGIARDYLDRAKARISETTELRPEQVLIACTHTHTGPFTGDDAYTAWLVDRIADGVRIAWQAREPAEIGWGSAEESRLVFNRRYRMTDGTVQTNPGVGNPEVVEPAGPVDPAVDALVLRRLNGGTLGVLGNHAMHYIGIPDDQQALSADYFGFFSTMLQRLRGENFVAALSNGASADINNIDVIGKAVRKNDRYQHCERSGAIIAASALWAWNEAAFIDDAPIAGALAEVPLTPRPPASAEDLAKAQDIEDRLAAKQKVLMGDRAFHRRVRRFQANPPVAHKTWVHALRIGELAIVGAPGELFVELGLEIKRRSPFAQTIVIELANDSIGYIPTLRAFEEGAYEPESSGYEPGFGEAIVEAAVGLLEKLKG